MESCLSIELIDFYLVVNGYQLISDPVERNVSFQEIGLLFSFFFSLFSFSLFSPSSSLSSHTKQILF